MCQGCQYKDLDLSISFTCYKVETLKSSLGKVNIHGTVLSLKSALLIGE